MSPQCDLFIRCDGFYCQNRKICVRVFMFNGTSVRKSLQFLLIKIKSRPTLQPPLSGFVPKGLTVTWSKHHEVWQRGCCSRCLVLCPPSPRVSSLHPALPAVNSFLQLFLLLLSHCKLQPARVRKEAPAISVVVLVLVKEEGVLVQRAARGVRPACLLACLHPPLLPPFTYSPSCDGLEAVGRFSWRDHRASYLNMTEKWTAWNFTLIFRSLTIRFPVISYVGLH